MAASPIFSLPARPGSRAEAVGHLFRRHKLEPIRNLDPLAIARVLDEYADGRLQSAALLWDKIERRDDRVRVVVAKRKRAVSSLEWQILSDADTPEADAHRAALEHLYTHLTVSDVMRRDMRGGIPTLVRHVMGAVGHGYAAAEILWRHGRDADGRDAYTAELVRVPLWFFEATEGRLRLLPAPFAQTGSELDPAGWLISASEDSPLHEATSLAYIFKIMPLRDYVFFVEKFGLPWVHGKTDATPGSREWDEYQEAVSALGNDCTLVTNLAADVDIKFATASGGSPHAELVDRMDRAIVALWMGGDLNTMSREGDSTGSMAQQGDIDRLRADDAEFVGEQLARLSLQCLQLLFGPQVRPLARFALRVPPTVEASRALSIIEKGVAHGVQIPVQYFRDTFSLPAPDDGEECLTAPAQPQQGGGFSPFARTPFPAANAADPDDLADALREDWDGALESVDKLPADQPGAFVQALRKLRASLPQFARKAQENSKLAETLADDSEDAVEEGAGNGSRGDAESAEESAANARTGYHEWKEDDHPRDADGKFSTTGQIAMGNKSLEMALRRKGDIRRAMMHNELGRIDFVWGRQGTPKPDKDGRTHVDGYGISHIQDKHPDALSHLAEIIAKGEVRPSRKGRSDKLEIHYGTRFVTVAKMSPKQNPWWRTISPKSERLSKRSHERHYYAVTALEDY
jgi:phage gp29-like protein